jgi:hypothetical protein
VHLRPSIPEQDVEVEASHAADDASSGGADGASAGPRDTGRGAGLVVAP